MANGLTEQQRAFVNALVVPGTLAQDAAIQAGYSPKTKDSQASMLLKNPKVAAYLQERRDRIAAAADIDAARVLREIGRLAFSDMRRYACVKDGSVSLVPSKDWSDDDAAAVAELSETVTKEGGTTRFKLHSKVQALEALARHLGLFPDPPPAQVLNLTQAIQIVVQGEDHI